jgi:hypothetical protein
MLVPELLKFVEGSVGLTKYMCSQALSWCGPAHDSINGLVSTLALIGKCVNKCVYSALSCR